MLNHAQDQSLETLKALSAHCLRRLNLIMEMTVLKGLTKPMEAMKVSILIT